MATEVQIAKLALSHLGDRYDLSSLSDATPEAEQIDLVFDQTRDMLLKEHPWAFAQKYYSPPYDLSGTLPADWDYMFDYPEDCIRMIEIVNPLGNGYPPIEFAVGVTDLEQKVIMCNVEEPEFRYTYRVTKASDFDVSFVDALSYRLAARVCVALTGDARLAAEIERKADVACGKAISQDANEGVGPPTTRGPDWLNARA